MLKIMKGIVILFFLVGCTVYNDKQENDDIPVENVSKSLIADTKVIATNLDIPWNITKTGQTFFLTQRVGKIVEIDEATGEKKQQNLQVEESILHEGEGGLLGFVLAQDFETSREAYAYHTYSQDGEIQNRIIKVKQHDEEWIEEAVILDGIPGGAIHNGGRMRIGPDGKLYVTTGDAGERDLSQDIQSVAGKILRMNLDGSIPSDNPFENSFVYSYGHRNPQGLAWDERGQLFSTEHGQSAHDEINIIKPGKNYGWPIIQGDEQAADMETPIYHTGEYTWAPSGIEYHNGKLYIATLRDSKIRSFEINTDKVDVILDIESRMRDVLIDNGNLYTITNNRDGRGTPQQGDDKLIQLVFEKN
ncbi:PQQ-dependent sugar dehydrogenase [Ferdinandcohnia quinoae]|uniref:PQQ-dependent sugar dehydrogenase n=1 Tax=Fredinandcohnia quinoae TaxID=2918902 RepID=A0AAW5E7Y9_9BACI|nr:PQQ-dependent sugar dehydrogenase [Fredinandcohnia sp. SECRCQ15]MCH1625511.1 PQQ-dependent sugar dehydrogenase [Fredinandcohnia sp. SECRCQ15]